MMRITSKNKSAYGDAAPPQHPSGQASPPAEPAQVTAQAQPRGVGITNIPWKWAFGLWITAYMLGMAATKSTTRSYQDAVIRQAWEDRGSETPGFLSSTFSSAENGNRGSKPIRQISILGERNSGTRWTFDHISECFSHAIPVKKELVRYKHWFQYRNTTKYPHDTLVLSQFRNPYDWLKAMEHVPHHSPNHLRLHTDANVTWQTSGNDWEKFLSKPWTMPRVGKDLDLINAVEPNNPEAMQALWNRKCQEDFKFKDIISCTVEPLDRSYYNWTLRYSENEPFYEMQQNGSGQPYANILELRTDKIRNFLSVADYPGVADVWVLQYEYLLRHGTGHLLDRISEWTGIYPRCKSKPPQTRKARRSRIVSKEFSAYVRKRLNWTVERTIGYDVEWHREQDLSEW